MCLAFCLLQIFHKNYAILFCRGGVAPSEISTILFQIMFVIFCPSKSFYNNFFQQCHNCVHHSRQCTKHNGACHHKVEAENLTSVHKQIAKSLFGNKVFPHDTANPRHTHVDFQCGHQRWHVAWRNQLGKNLKPTCTHGAQKQYLFPIGVAKSVQNCDGGNHHGNQHSHRYDGCLAGARPNDDDWSQSNFWQAV